MKRSRALSPAVPDPLEGRVVPSQVYLSPPLGLVGDAVASVSTGMGKKFRVKAAAMIERTTLNNGQIQTTNIVAGPIAAGGVLIARVAHNPDGTTTTINTTATTLHGTTTYTRGIVLPDGSSQTETGSEYTQPSATTIRPGGTLRPHPGGRAASRATVFTRVVTPTKLDGGSGSGSGSPSRGTGSIVGSTVTQVQGNRTISATDEQVTNFDGSQMEVRIFTVIKGGITTNRATVIDYATGSVTTTTTTSRITSSTGH